MAKDERRKAVVVRLRFMVPMWRASTKCRQFFKKAKLGETESRWRRQETYMCTSRVHGACRQRTARGTAHSSEKPKRNRRNFNCLNKTNITSNQHSEKIVFKKRTHFAIISASASIKVGALSMLLATSPASFVSVLKGVSEHGG